MTPPDSAAPDGSRRKWIVLGDVLLQDVQQRLCLLGAEEIPWSSDGDAVGRRLAQCAEEEKKVPEIGADLHAVGDFAIFRRVTS